MAIDESKYLIKPFYQGGYSSLNPNKGDNFVGYHVKTGGIGIHTDPRLANQVGELSRSLNTGTVVMEVGTLSPQTFDQIPKQHFAEMRRLGKLTGAKVTLHAPIQGVEPSGLDPQGQRPWDELQRVAVERQLTDVAIKAIDMQGKTDRVPITIHASNLLGSEYIPDGKGGLTPHRLAIVNKESGQVGAIEQTKKFEPGMEEKHFKDSSGKLKGEGKSINPMQEIEKINKDAWVNTISNIAYNKSFVDRSIRTEYPLIQHLEKEKNLKADDLKKYPEVEEAYRAVKNYGAILKNTEKEVFNFFNQAYKNGTPEEQDKLFKASQNYAKQVEEIKKSGGNSIIKQSEAIQGLLETLQEVRPRLYVPVEEFVMDKSAKTFGNVGFNAFTEAKKQGKESPIISIENLFPGMGFSTGQAMNDLITKSRQEFVNKAMQKGMDKKEAEKTAEKVIGMTLDVGHLNIHKKEGVTDKELLGEVEKVKKLVKHVHITDNFGYGDSHLPPGMGNVPIAKVLEQLEKEGYSGSKIMEVGGWFEHFKTNPYNISLEGLGVPIGEGLGTYWNQSAGGTQGYFGGYGTFLPQINYETFGGGFSALPTELGGQRGGGAGSRMSGRGME